MDKINNFSNLFPNAAQPLFLKRGEIESIKGNSELKNQEINELMGVGELNPNDLILKNSENFNQNELDFLNKFDNFEPLSGYTNDGKISIWGKILGLDKSFSENERQDLISFLNESGGLLIEWAQNGQRNDAASVSELINLTNYELRTDNDKVFKINSLKILAKFAEFTPPKSLALLDSDMEISDFKAEFLAYILEQKDKIKTTPNEIKSIQNDIKETKENNFKPIQGYSKNQENETLLGVKNYYELIKQDLKNGKKELEILKNILNNKVDFRA